MTGYRVLDTRGVDLGRLLLSLIELDRRTTGLEQDRDPAVWLEHWPTIMTLADSWQVILEHDQIYGYWHFVPMAGATFEKAKRGDLDELDISPSDVEVPSSPGNYRAYFIGIATDPDLRSPAGSSFLYSSFFSYLLGKAREGVFFREWLCYTATEVGGHLCGAIGFAMVGKMRYLHTDNVNSAKIPRELASIYRR